MQLSGIIFAALFFGVFGAFLIFVASTPFNDTDVSTHEILGDENYVYAYCEQNCLINIAGSDNVIEVIIVYHSVIILVTGDRNIVSLPQNTKYVLNDTGAGNYVTLRDGTVL